MIDELIVNGPEAPADVHTQINKTISQYLIDVAKFYGDKVLMIDGATEKELRLREALNRSFEIASRLQSIGCKKEDVVGIICENSVEYIVWMLAILHTGAAVVAFNRMYVAAPAELENLLLKHKSVNDAAVIGIPDEIADELPKAFVVKKPGAQVTENDITQYIDNQVSPQKKLRGAITFVNEIPKNPSGKILRQVLRTWSKPKI